MASSYELRRYPNGEIRLEVRGYSELLAPELRGELIDADAEKRSDDSE